MYSRCNKSFDMIHHFLSCKREQCKIILPLAFATGSSLNQEERQPVQSNQDENTYGWEQIKNGQYIKMSLKGGSTNFVLVSTVIHK
jgi:hypothetical protein